MTVNPRFDAEELAEEIRDRTVTHSIPELLAVLTAAVVNQPTPAAGHIVSTVGRDNNGELWFEHQPVAYFVRGLPYIAYPIENRLDNATDLSSPTILWHPDTMTGGAPLTREQVEADLTGLLEVTAPA